MDFKTIVILPNGHKVNGTAHYTKSGEFVFYSAPLSAIKRHYGKNAINLSFAIDGKELVADVSA